ncbi:beta strand repeat-containing protein, partial [Testudinibacter sp. TR-2022]|uniref:beta strand repeat-containing protein n=1 Tax=Testudinibacter sp. TR-2022 TaxID=2585029 RepID=UPI001167D349
AAGTNVSSVTTATGANDQTIYTVNADGASVSAANESAVSVVKAEKDSTTNITDYALDLTQATKDDIQKGVDAKETVDSKGLTFSGDNGSTDEKLLGSKVAINGDDNITTTATADSVKIGLNKNLTVDSVVAGNTTINTDGITITGGTNNVSLTNTGLNNGGNSITNVASGGNVDSNAANIGDVKTAAAAAKSEVKAGTNVVSVDESKGADNQTVYTVNAKGTTASAGSSAVTVEPGASDVNNVTDYKVDLSEASKASLAKADTALQTVVTQIDGAEVKTLTKDSNNANFVTGDNIELTADNGGIKIATAKEVAFDKVSVGSTVINGDGLSINNGPSITSSGIDVAGNKISNVAAGENDTDAVNMSQLNQVAANQKVAKVIAGNNTKVTAEVDDNTTTYTVNAEKATVTGSTAIVATASDKGNDVTDYALDLTQATKDDIQKGVDAKETVDSKGLTFTGDSGSSDEKLLGSQVAVNGDENITTTADKNGVKVALNKDLTGLNSVSANTVNAGSVVVGDANNSTTLTGTANGLDVGGDKITNVAAGDVNENSTDAVNGSQLHTTNTNVANNTKNIAQNTAEIEKGINFGDGATSTQYQLGDTINVKGDSNVTSTTTADGVQLALAKNINLDSVTTGNTLLNDAGITINGGANSPVSLTNNGLNNGGNQITNVASGGDVDSNAANIGDVKTAAAAAKSEVAAGTNVSSVTTATGANDQTIYTVNADGASVSAANESAVSVVKAEKDSTTNITDYALDLTQTTKDNIQKGVDAKSAVDSKGLTFSGDNGSTDEKLLGSKVAINGDDNITTTATADSVKIALNKNLTVDSVVAGNTTINTDGITITGGANNVSLTNSGLNNGGNAITNVAAGINDSDAVNVAQLKEVRTTAAAHSTVVAGDNVTVTTDTNADGGVEYNVAVPNAVVYDNDAHDSITLGGTSASEPVNLTNVKAGELNATSTDAVNGSQLHATNQNVAANSANIAQNTADIATNAANIVKGINFGDGSSSNNFALGATINVKGDNNIISTTTADGVQLGLANNVTIGTAKPVTINGDSGTIGGLSNTSWNADNITSGQAATEDQLKAVSNIANQGFNLTSSASDGEVSGSSVEQVAPGETVTIDAGKNIAVTQNGNQISIATLNNLTVDSVVAGNSVLNNTGLTINDGTNGTVSLTNAGLNNGGNAITNVAAGVNDSDAVNVAQLNDVKKAAAAAATEITQGDNIVVTESKGKDGQTIYNVATAKDLNIDSVTAGDTVLNQNGVAVSDKVALSKDGLRVGDVSISTTGINAGGNKISGVAEGDISATSTDAVNGSQLYKIQQQAQAQSSVVAGDNIEVTTATNANGGVEYSVATAKVVSFDKTTVGTVVTDSSTNKISGLANGNISATSSDAVNGSQLYNNTKAVAATLGGGSAVDVNGNITAPTYTVTDGNPSSGNSVTVHTVGAAISNLTAGVQKPLTFETDSGSYVARLGSTIGIKGDGNNISTSADSNGNITVKMSDTPNFTSIKTGNTTVGNNGVTVTGGDNGTVSLTSNGLNNGGNRITNVAPGVEGTDAVNVNQLSAVNNTINNRINKVDNRASAGTASAMAAAGLPQAYLPGHSMVAVAGGTHRGENAMALGVSRISDNGKVIVKLTGATNSEKDTSASIGVGYQW